MMIIIIIIIVVMSRKLTWKWLSQDWELHATIDQESKSPVIVMKEREREREREREGVCSLICAKNTTFAVNFYLRILPSASVHRRFRTSAFKCSLSLAHPLSATRNPQLMTFASTSASTSTFYLLHLSIAGFEHPHLKPSVIRFH